MGVLTMAKKETTEELLKELQGLPKEEQATWLAAKTTADISRQETAVLTFADMKFKDLTKTEQLNLGIQGQGIIPYGVGSTQWLAGVGRRWTPAAIAALQRKLFLDPTGKYDANTQSAHMAFFEAKHFKDETYALDMAKIRAENLGRSNEYLMDRAVVVQDKIWGAMTSILGYEPTVDDFRRAYQAYGLDRYFDIYEYAELKNKTRRSEGFLRTYPGIQSSMTPQEYMKYREKMEHIMRTFYHRPATNDDFALLMQKKLPPIKMEDMFPGGTY